MVDCFDRIAVQMTEMALEPVKQLAQLNMLTRVSLRIASGGRKFEISVLKRAADSGWVYRWELCEIDHHGEVLSDREIVSTAITYPDPETAWWGAVDALCARKR